MGSINYSNNEEIKRFCLAFAKAESEQEVIEILEDANLWDDLSLWADYDRNPNNFSTIGNQQSSPDAALVEKLINAVDAVLMRECIRRGMNPESNEAPKSIQEALKKYFNLYEGKLSSIDSTERTKLAENIMLVATGKKSSPCFSIIDLGEGQTPNKMPDTFLSLNKNNKLKIHFVQGKFNMGGTGALQFCSPKHNLQLIISKRDPHIKDFGNGGNDESKDKWGFTIVRRVDPTGNIKCSSFKYLAPNNKILSFYSDGLPLLPGEYTKAYERLMYHGTYIKLYEYQLTGYKTNILFDLYNRLSLLLPGIALPIRMIERRHGYSGHSYEATLAGLSIRLEEDKKENLEAGFPSSSKMKIQGQEMDVSIYAFKKGKRENYATKEGIIFVVNGQAHGFLSKAFFERKSVGMAYLADSILIIVDCSKFDRRIQEDLFMNSRDRLRSSDIRYEIENQLEELIRNHSGLRELREKRRREEIENKVKDAKPIAEILENVIAKSPTLTKLLLLGERISNPFQLASVGTSSEFKGKRFPTYFKLSKEFPREKPKEAHINRRFRVSFETDAENEYFNRDLEPGRFLITLNGKKVEDFTLNLWNGNATLSVSLPEGVQAGNMLHIHTETTDNSRVQPFINEFYLLVKPEEPCVPGQPGKRKDSPGEEGEKERKLP